ncbi:MAG: transglutaminase domain-containing protein [Verrucomicrobia bacterium]|nr:transglutaminase domain-containing protein [Verrucomicrobiota bacterium]
MNRDGLRGSMARTPLLAALALWGWQAELLPWAVAMGVLLTAPQWVRLRWELTPADFSRLWNFTALLFFGTGLYLFLARETLGDDAGGGGGTGPLEGIRVLTQAFLQFLRSLPLIFFPFLLVHAWSGTGALPWWVFSIYTRARAAARTPDNAGAAAGWRVDPVPAYLALTAFASCATTRNAQIYLPLLLGVVMMGLWPWRNRSVGWTGRLVLLAFLAGVTVAVPPWLDRARAAWQSLEGRLLSNAGGRGFDALRSVTTLGAVGRRQTSGGIVLRVRSSAGESPGLLREAVYNRYRSQTWAATHRDFMPVDSSGDASVWRVAPGRRSGLPMVISRATAGAEAPLALPGDVVTVRDLPRMLIETNYLGTARLRGGPAIAIYGVERGPEGGLDGPPEPADTDLDPVSGADRAAVDSVNESLRLGSLAPAVAVRTLERYFASGFEYSLWQPRRRTSPGDSPLAVFLKESRSGHCEYFATATVLILRAAGIPARYAVGYSPQRRSDEEWIARGRDAHAWCLAHVDGRWRVVDTTPGSWREFESSRAGWMEGLRDRWSDAWFQFAVWRQQGGNWQVAVFVAGMLGLSWMGWRQLRGSRWRRASGAARPPAAWRPPGWDSEFFPALRALEKRHGARPDPMPVGRWLQAVMPAGHPMAPAIHEAATLHSRLRFDPEGLPADQRVRLRELAREIQG